MTFMSDDINHILGDPVAIYTSLQDGQGEKYTIYSKSMLPDEWHYSKSSDVQSIVLMAHPGYVFGDFQRLTKLYQAEHDRPDDLSAIYGCNGYNNSLDKMHTTLFARGPAFKAGSVYEISPNATLNVNTIDVFSLLCHVLDLGTECNRGRDGNLKNLYSVLSSPPGGGIKETIHKFATYVTSPEHMTVTRTL
jgi:hypothetical protein